MILIRAAASVPFSRAPHVSRIEIGCAAARPSRAHRLCGVVRRAHGLGPRQHHASLKLAQEACVPTDQLVSRWPNVIMQAAQGPVARWLAYRP
jgi:hypothetical protein